MSDPNHVAVFAVALLFALFSTLSRAAMIHVTAQDDLQERIDAAKGGDVLLLDTGTYQGFSMAGRHFTVEKPLVIRAAPGARPLLLGSDYGGYLAKMTDCSYLVLDGLTLENSNQPIYCRTIDHVIFVNLEVHNSGQEMIHIRGTSRYVDIRHCRLYDSGHHRPQWSEGIYIGTGQPPEENTEHVWIEGNDISRTGNSEGINIKSRSYHVTIRGNRVHDLAPGTATQHNEAAISCEAADLSFQPGVDPDIWIEKNEIWDVKFGRWAHGIQATTMGGRIINNHIHDCQQFGIHFNAYNNGPGAFPTWLFGNTIERCAAGEVEPTDLVVKNGDPGANPNQPQAWYHSKTTLP